MNSLFATLCLLLICQLPVPGTANSVDDTVADGVTQSTPLPEGYVSYPDIGLAYWVRNGSYRSWTKAEESCTITGAHLAVIDSEKKLEYALRPPIGDFYGIRHVGIHRVGNDWLSIGDGRNVTSIPWANDQPFIQYRYRCTAISYGPLGRRIMSTRCDSYGDYVCEMPLPAAV